MSENDPAQHIFLMNGGEPAANDGAEVSRIDRILREKSSSIIA